MPTLTMPVLGGPDITFADGNVINTNHLSSGTVTYTNPNNPAETITHSFVVVNGVLTVSVNTDKSAYTVSGGAAA
jgi:hypothetical protein